MPTRIDHIIAAAANLAALEATFQRLGFSVTGGGTHPHLGTRNRIILLGEGYLELLAVADPSKVSPALRQRLVVGDGWVGFALQSGDIPAEVAEMRWRGVDVRGPTPGRLVAPDGTARGWRVALIGGEDLWAAAEPSPFLIQHDTSGAQHQRELAGADGIHLHPNGATTICDVTLAVMDLEASARRFAAEYDLLATDPMAHETALNADTLTLPLTSGECVILAQPTGPGLAQRRIETAGEGLCRASIGMAKLAATATYLRQTSIPFAEADDGLHLAPEVAGGAALRFIED